MHNHSATIMASTSSLLLLCVGVGVLLLAVVSAENFVPHRTHLVDTNAASGNFLFRGNMPKTAQGTFAYDELVSTLQDVAQNHSMTLPSSFYLVDISFLVGLDPKESGDLALEGKYFQDNPTKGELINWPILTDLLGPCDESKSARDKAARSGKWDLDDVPHRVGHIRSMLTTKASQPQVIYMHCEAGVDRTGEVSGSYVMQFQNQTFAEVLAFDDSVEPRPITDEAKHGLEWYALYVELALGNPSPKYAC